jgi:cation transporter-like permease
MTKIIHLIAAVLATSTIAVFFLSTVIVELFAGSGAIANVKSLIVFPGLLVLIPAIAATGGTGFALSKVHHGSIVATKKKRMPFIAANGLLVLIPCAVVLDAWASAGSFDARFNLVQVLELIAGATNLTLMGLNMRDGFRLQKRHVP